MTGAARQVGTKIPPAGVPPESRRFTFVLKTSVAVGAALPNTFAAAPLILLKEVTARFFSDTTHAAQTCATNQKDFAKIL